MSEDKHDEVEVSDVERNQSEVAQPDDDESKSTRTFDVAYADLSADVAYTVPSAAYFVSPAEYAAFDPANLSEQVILKDDHMVLSQGNRTANGQEISGLQTSASPAEASTPVTSGAWLRVSREL